MAQMVHSIRELVQLLKTLFEALEEFDGANTESGNMQKIMVETLD